jgi:hypothetical protein
MLMELSLERINMYKYLIMLALVGGLQDEKTKTVGDYRNELKKLTEWSEKLEKADYYNEKFKFKEKKTDKVKKLTDLPEFEQSVFMLLMSDVLTKKLEELHNTWTKDLTNAKEEEDDDDSDDGTATKTHINKYLKELDILRKKTAVRVESYAHKVFKKYNDKFTDQEKKQFIKNMEMYHDSHKLIERKELLPKPKEKN